MSGIGISDFSFPLFSGIAADSIRCSPQRVRYYLYFRPPTFLPASSSARSASTIILRPICVPARSILPLRLMRQAVGILHPNSRAIPGRPYTYFFDVSTIGCGGASSGRALWFCRNISSSPVICHTGFDINSSIFIISTFKCLTLGSAHEPLLCSNSCKSRVRHDWSGGGNTELSIRLYR